LRRKTHEPRETNAVITKALSRKSNARKFNLIIVSIVRKRLANGAISYLH
jgi:hypothetical protein